MIEYYFCEECETYHHPNRIINGQVLAACECQVQTEEASENNRKTSEFRKLDRDLNQAATHIHHRIHVEYPAVRSVSREQKYQNMPFMSIISEENKKELERIRINQENEKRNNSKLISRVVSEKMMKKPERVQSPRQFIPPPSSIQIVKPSQKIQSHTSLQYSNNTPINSIKKITQIQPIQSVHPHTQSKDWRLSQAIIFSHENQEKECCYKCCYF